MTPSDSLTPDDLRYLERAVALGREGWAGAHPNPMVGCVVVREGRVVGEGFHERFGGPHAEIHALRQAGERARGATAYVSLEPCNHQGKTPPCSRALADAGIRRVVFGASDPGTVSGGGGEALRAAGIRVQGPAFPPGRAQVENPAFFYNAEKNRPYLALKLAQSLDGRIASRAGTRTTITGPEAHAEVHRLRAGFDAVMVGSGTALADDPLLTVRDVGSSAESSTAPSRQPARIVLDSLARISPNAKLLQDPGEGGEVIIFTSPEAPSGAVAGLEDAGAKIHAVDGGEGGLSLNAVLDICWEGGLRSIFCEGGGRLASALLTAELAQRLYLFVAPFVLGEAGVPAFPGLGGSPLWERLVPATPPAPFGRDVLLTLDWTD